MAFLRAVQRGFDPRKMIADSGRPFIDSIILNIRTCYRFHLQIQRPFSIQLNCKHLSSRSKGSSKFPEKRATSFVSLDDLPEVSGIDLALVEHLERMALVEFASEQGLRELKDAIKSANQILDVDTEGVEPLESLVENRPIWLREDEVTEGNCAEEILSNATKVEEQYFVAPPGNIPLKKKHRKHFDDHLGNQPDEDSEVDPSTPA